MLTIAKIPASKRQETQLRMAFQRYFRVTIPQEMVLDFLEGRCDAMHLGRQTLVLWFPVHPVYLNALLLAGLDSTEVPGSCSDSVW